MARLDKFRPTSIAVDALVIIIIQVAARACAGQSVLKVLSSVTVLAAQATVTLC